MVKETVKLPQRCIENNYEKNVVSRLIGMNDSGKSFEKIAQWIETHL